jgi:DNA-binding transcriptional ArsR family regulator
MKSAPTIAAAILLIAAAQGARGLARDEANGAATGADAGPMIDEPFAPSPEAAPFASLGYRELAADLLLARAMPYLGGRQSTAEGMAGLCEAIVASDPQYRMVYEWCAHAMSLARTGVDQRTYLRAIALLERGMQELPDDWRIPYTAGQMYMLDLQTDDPAQRRAWNERGALLIEAAIRKPNAPADAATLAAALRTKLGQRQRAIDDLRELLLITGDDAARRRILDKLAELSHASADDLAAELLEARRRFEADWLRERPTVPATMYLLIGPHPAPGFDLRELATGGHDLLGEQLLGRGGDDNGSSH